MIHTKIVATIGPASCSRDMLIALSNAGMNVARLNGSHADLDWHASTIKLIKEALPDTPILLDIPGRKIRTVQLAHEPSFEHGDIVILTTDQSHDGTQKVPVNYPMLHEDLQAGTIIFADDGTLSFVCEKVDGPDIYMRAETAGVLRSRKGINVPSVQLRTQLVTERDHEMMQFAAKNGVDFVGVSFVESADHVRQIRELGGINGPRIIAKIENQGGMTHLAEIALAADALMIDRGDLSVETSLEKVPLYQKQILGVANEIGKPVIVATEMLHTMIDNSIPTKAEVCDIANAVLDGCAATMLSGETAVGSHPVKAVEVMRSVSETAAEFFGGSSADSGTPSITDATVPKAMEAAISGICSSLPVSKLVAVTISGYAARVLATGLTQVPILAVSNDPMAARSFNLLPGTEGIFVDIQFGKSSTDHIIQCLEELWRMSKLADNDLVLITAVGYPKSGNRMNLLQTHYMSDLVESLDWRR
jgi:pyruvate kinase